VKKALYQWQSKGKVIVVSVKDTGSGIHPEIKPKLFSKFASKSFSGTGRANCGRRIDGPIAEEP
jgi:signal transduction histidine kinase